MSDSMWVVVADGAKAFIFRYCGYQAPLELVENGTLEGVNAPSHDLVTTQRGRILNSANGQRSALERPSDPHQFQKHQFASEVADFLHQHNSEFDQLVLVASPKMLGDLRNTMPQSDKDKVTAELGKDFTNTPLAKLPKKLSQIIRINPKIQMSLH